MTRDRSQERLGLATPMAESPAGTVAFILTWDPSARVSQRPVGLYLSPLVVMNFTARIGYEFA